MDKLAKTMNNRILKDALAKVNEVHEKTLRLRTTLVKEPAGSKKWHKAATKHQRLMKELGLAKVEASNLGADRRQFPGYLPTPN